MIVKLSKYIFQQVEDLEAGFIKEEILPALGNELHFYDGNIGNCFCNSIRICGGQGTDELW